MADIRINALATTATTPAPDDYLALDGTAQGTRKILATNIANNVTDVILGSSGPSVKSTLSARAPRQGLVFDGTAGASANVGTIGSSPVSFGGRCTIPASGTNVLFAISASATTPAQPKALAIYTFGTSLYVQLNAAIGNYLLGEVSGFVTTYAGKVVDILAVRSTSGNIALYVNGLATSPSFSSVGGSAPANWQADIDGPYALLGITSVSAWVAGTFYPPVCYNRALSASEVVALYEAGAPAGADYNSASNTAINSSAFTNFNYDTFSSASATGFTAVNTSGTTEYAQGNPVSITGLKYGNVIRVTYSLTLNSGQLPQVVLGNIGTETHSAFYPLTAGSNQTVDIVVSTNSGTSTNIAFRSTAASNYAISSVSAQRIGLLLAPDAAQAGNGYVWNDQSGNLAQIVLPSSGVQWNLPSVATNRIRGTTSTNGNQQLLGASVLLPAECQITHVRARARSGTPTITIGTASGGAQIVASVALSTTWLNCTIALTGGIVSSADDIWIGSNSTDVVETDIAFQPLDF